uniref:Uncharacterized protein n=1 Tax=Eptatretus burgeri TaxID=7764 RepID=A0A8C4Q4P6_EPTBU
MDQHHYEFKLRAIMSEHKRTITAISWSPHCPEVFASASMDGLLIIWNVIERKVVSRLKLIEGLLLYTSCGFVWRSFTKVYTSLFLKELLYAVIFPIHLQCLPLSTIVPLPDTPSFLSWCPDCSDTVTFTSPSGPLYLWTVSETESNVVPHHEAHNFLSEVCLFRWHPQNNGRVVFGHSDGSISIFQPGRKSQKHMLRPEALEGTDEEDPITALEWDPLSAAYLLVANQGNGLRLLDVDSLTCITCFSLPSIVMTVRCLTWLKT